MKNWFRLRVIIKKAFAREGAAMAVDGSLGTFWASKLDDTKGPVEFIIDFGDEQQLEFIEIDWEFPARGFAVSLSVVGEVHHPYHRGLKSVCRPFGLDVYFSH